MKKLKLGREPGRCEGRIQRKKGDKKRRKKGKKNVQNYKYEQMMSKKMR